MRYWFILLFIIYFTACNHDSRNTSNEDSNGASSCLRDMCDDGLSCQLNDIDEYECIPNRETITEAETNANIETETTAGTETETTMGNQIDYTELCQAFCSLDARCEPLIVAHMCRDHNDCSVEPTNILSSSDTNCQMSCETFWVDNNYYTLECATARRNAMMCAFNTTCEDLIYNLSNICEEESDDVVQICDNENDYQRRECRGAFEGDGVCYDKPYGPSVNIENQLPRLVDVKASNMCSISSLTQVELRLNLLGNSSIDLFRLTPGSGIKSRGTAYLIPDILTSNMFTFIRPSNERFEGDAPSIATSLEGQQSLNVILNPGDAQFSWNGGIIRKNDPRLVIFAMDNSGSLRGLSSYGEAPDLSNASDLSGLRINFFQRILHEIEDSVFVSVVPFQGESINLNELSTPTLNRDISSMIFDDLVRTSMGETPLADTLIALYERIILDNSELNPTVILFTDGVERGDPSQALLDDVIGIYETANIPTIIFHIQPPDTVNTPLGRDSTLQRLACRTGGAYFFLENAESLSQVDDHHILDLLIGHWRLLVYTDLEGILHPNTGYLLTTELTVRLDEFNSQSIKFIKSETNPSDDQRVWLVE